MTITSVNLRREAEVEVRRLASARALLQRDDERALRHLEGDATWIAMAGRSGLRRSLGTSVCLIWRVAFEDASSRVVESRLVAVRVALRRSGSGLSWSRQRRAWIKAFLNHADHLVSTAVEEASQDWRAEVVPIANAFSSARLRRELAIAGREALHPATAQPGLFDRRAERSRDARRSTTADSERISAERLRAIGAAAQITPMHPRLMLVILP
jgi:hypothetical protein